MDELKHSGLGIAAFVISLISGVALFLLIVMAGILETTTPGGINEESVEAVVIGLFLFFFIGTALLSLILGLFGLFQKERKKLFAILGIAFSSVALFVTLFLLLLGMTVG